MTEKEARIGIDEDFPGEGIASGEDFEGHEIEEFDVDFDSDLDDVDLSGFGEVDEEILHPHVQISTTVFKEFLTIAKQVVTSSSRDMVSKSVSIEPRGDVAILRVTDFDVYFEMTTDIINTHDVLTETAVIPLAILSKVVKAVPARTTIIQKDGNYFIRLLGGDLLLEFYSVSHEKFIFSEELKLVVTLSSLELGSIIKDFSGIVQAAINPIERRISFESDASYANYLWAVIRHKGVFADFDLRVKDIAILRNVLKKQGDIRVLKTKHAKTERMVMEGEDFRYVYLKTEAKVPALLKNSMDTFLAMGMYVDLVHLYRIIEVAAELPYGVGKVGLNFEEGVLSVGIKTRKGNDSVLKIAGSVSGEVGRLETELVVQAKILRALLRSFVGSSSVRVSLASGGIGISSDKYSAVLYSEGS